MLFDIPNEVKDIPSNYKNFICFGNQFIVTYTNFVSSKYNFLLNVYSTTLNFIFKLDIKLPFYQYHSATIFEHKFMCVCYYDEKHHNKCEILIVDLATKEYHTIPIKLEYYEDVWISGNNVHLLFYDHGIICKMFTIFDSTTRKCFSIDQLDLEFFRPNGDNIIFYNDTTHQFIIRNYDNTQQIQLQPPPNFNIENIDIQHIYFTEDQQLIIFKMGQKIIMLHIFSNKYFEFKLPRIVTDDDNNDYDVEKLDGITIENNSICLWLRLESNCWSKNDRWFKYYEPIEINYKINKNAQSFI